MTTVNELNYPRGLRPGDPIFSGSLNVGRVASIEEANTAPIGSVNVLSVEDAGQRYSVPAILKPQTLYMDETQADGLVGQHAINLQIRSKTRTFAAGAATAIVKRVGDTPSDPGSLGEYSRALDAQLEMLQFATSERGMRWITLMANKDAAIARNFYRAAVQSLRYAQPFYVTRSICEHLIKSTPKLPLVEMTEEMLPAPIGFVLFDQPLPIPEPPSDLPGASPWRDDIEAIAWLTARTEISDAADSVIFTYFARPERGALRPVMSYLVEFGEHQIAAMTHGLETEREKLGLERIEDEPHHAQWQRIRRLRMNYTFGFLQFVQQRIKVMAHDYRANRATRKRVEAAKEWDEEPLVRVVEFRKREYTGSGEGRDGWQLQHSFVVGEGTGGFYQTYHTKNGPIRRKVEPYTKGAGLPPKRTQITINVVKR